MLFTSYKFIAFLVVLFLLYYTLPKKFQISILLVFSYIFYACANPVYLIYILATTVIIYGTGLVLQKISDQQQQYFVNEGEKLSKEDKKLYKKEQKKKQKRYLSLCLVLIFGILFSTKYMNFLIENINSLLTSFGNMSQISFIGIILPMGISFYTLQAAGYVIDVYHGAVKAEKNFLKLALFVSFFPQLVQGPISRFGDLSKTLYKEHSFESKQFFFGLQRILWGFFKKIVIADCVMTGVSTIIGDLSTYNGAYIFVGIFLYTLDLYADFTGGIDITIGIAQSLGITVAENFNRPYFSKTLKEYWRRWHITMCEWFRIYVFYSVSTSKWLKSFTKFSRKHFGEYIGKRLPVYVASFVVWFSTGIWHGASWNFIVWGLLNWAILMFAEEIESPCERFHHKYHWNEKIVYKGFQILRTFVLVSCLNLFDCYASVSDTMYAFASMFTVHNWNIFRNGALLEIGLKATDYVVLIFGILIMFVVSLIQEKGSVREQIAQKPYAFRAVIWCVLVLVILVFGTYGIGYDSSQFIYNRF